MDGVQSFFSSDGGMRQVSRSGDALFDLTTGRPGFVISESDGSALVSDGRGRMHSIIKNGSVSYDLTTGKSWFEL